MLLLDIVVLTLHLILAGIAAAGPIVAGVAQWRGARRADLGVQRAALKLGRESLHALFAAGALGFLLWFLYGLQRGTEFAPRGERLGRLWTIDAWTFWGELSFSAVTLTIAVILARRERGQRWLVPVLMILAGTNLLYHLPLRFSIFNIMQSRGLDLPEGLTRAIKYQLLGEPLLWSRLTHHWGAQFVAAGLAWQWIRASAKYSSADSTTKTTSSGAILVLLGTLTQFASGPWLLFMLPATRQENYLGDQPLAAACLGAGIGAALASLLPSYGLVFDSTAELRGQQRRRTVATLLLAAAWTGMVAGQLVQR
jgi:hypothetical protein